MSVKFSIIIPLYNKEAEIGRTLRSVFAQTVEPVEIVVVDDGSTDGSAAVVESFGDRRIHLITQKNAGVSAARNRAITSASGDYIALLDADDEWKPTFLEEIAGLIGDFPGCGIYCTGYEIADEKGIHQARNLERRGIVENFFRASLTAHIVIPSASVIPRNIFEIMGGFPEGMRLGEEQYQWIKIARQFHVCFSPKRLVRYWKAASNRSAATYKPEKTDYSFEDFLVNNKRDRMKKTDHKDFWIREFVARVALGKAITIASKGDRNDNGSLAGNLSEKDRDRMIEPLDSPRQAEHAFNYTTRSRRLWLRLWFLNRTPKCLRPLIHNLYTTIAWKLFRRGL